MDYKKFLVKQQVYNGTTYTDYSSIVDTFVNFNIVCQEFPYNYTPETKELSKHDWYDENGEDVYIPVNGLKYKAYDLEATFLYKGAADVMHTKIKQFIQFLTCKGILQPLVLAIYDEYTGIGLRGVYVLGVSTDLYEYKDTSLGGLAMFKVKFRITDPVTHLDENLEILE